MTRLRVKPVARTYQPGYPTFTEVDWHQLVADSSVRTFGPRTIALAGIIGSSIFIQQSCAPVDNHGLRSQNKKALVVARNALNDLKNVSPRNERSQTVGRLIVEGNPLVTVPHYEVSFGNSFSGILDTVRARAVTVQLFEAYGIDLTVDYPYSKDGIEAALDGYNEDLKIGFEILGVDNNNRLTRFVDRSRANTALEKELDAREQEALMGRVRQGEESLFLAHGGQYPKVGRDEYTPLHAYLQSALDYLDWLKREGQI